MAKAKMRRKISEKAAYEIMAKESNIKMAAM